MASLAWYAKQLSLGVGALGVLLAWDRHDTGPSAADDPAGNAAGDVGLYSWVGFTSGKAFASAKSKSPVQLAESGLPEWLGDPFHDYVVRFALTSGSTGLGPFVSQHFEIQEGGSQVYASDEPMVELADGSFGLTNLSFFDRVRYHPWLEPLDGPAYFLGHSAEGPWQANELWRLLMTPNETLKTPPFSD
ncbi:hypothetical protein [Microbacterium pumilum]|uniref:Uncharacterized protein n=1 Tax=Microbacterium pumilum TaxID=344165 RepID=A0ABN2T6R0_9MICO